MRVAAVAPFLVVHGVVQDLPNDAAYIVGHGPDGLVVFLGVPSPDAPVARFEYGALGLDRRIGRLIEQASHGLAL
jgi:hypothetical protein